MKTKNVFLELLKLFGAFIVVWLIFVIIFAAFTADANGNIPDLYQKAAMGLSIVIAVLFVIITNFNKVKRLKVLADASYSNISIHESDVQTSVAQYRSATASDQVKPLRKVTTSTDFKTTIENYPDLKADKSIQQLMEQIINSENLISSAKINYNDMVTQYNLLIQSFPINLMKNIWKIGEFHYYSEPVIEITDEMLGL